MKHPLESRRIWTAGLLIGATLLWCCTFGDLTVHGKRCDEAHLCPEPFLCVMHPENTDNVRSGRCFKAEDAEPCPAPRFCDQDDGRDWVVLCDEDGFSSSFQADCAEQVDQTCNPDTGSCADSCAGGQACPQSGEVCDTGIELCRPGPACEDFSCVPAPTSEATVGQGDADLECFLPGLPPTDEGIATTCSVGGLVHIFPNLNAERTVGLTIEIRDAEDPDRFTRTGTVFANASFQDRGFFTFDEVPTRRRYDIILHAGQTTDSEPVVKSVRAGIELRADICDEGSGFFTQSINTMKKATYDTYTQDVVREISPDVDFDERRGLLMGKITDCGDRPLGNVTAGLAIPASSHGRVYYFEDNPLIIVQDLSLQATSNKGYYAAVEVPATPNQVAFKAMYASAVIRLGAIGFTMEPGAVVTADLVLPERRLP